MLPATKLPVCCLWARGSPSRSPGTPAQQARPVRPQGALPLRGQPEGGWMEQTGMMGLLGSLGSRRGRAASPQGESRSLGATAGGAMRTLRVWPCPGRPVSARGLRDAVRGEGHTAVKGWGAVQPLELSIGGSVQRESRGSALSQPEPGRRGVRWSAEAGLRRPWHMGQAQVRSWLNAWAQHAVCPLTACARCGVESLWLGDGAALCPGHATW